MHRFIYYRLTFCIRKKKTTNPFDRGYEKAGQSRTATKFLNQQKRKEEATQTTVGKTICRCESEQKTCFSSDFPSPGKSSMGGAAHRIIYLARPINAGEVPAAPQWTRRVPLASSLPQSHSIPRNRSMRMRE